VSLLFKDYASNKEYVVTATTGEGGDVKAEVSYCNLIEHQYVSIDY